MKTIARGLFNPLAIRAGTVVFSVGMLVLVLLSPIALRQFAQTRGVNWGLLSDIGQTYGAVSALLTALALGGVVLSLLYQSRQLNVARNEAARTVHNELLRLEMEDPIYMEAMGAPWGLEIQDANYTSLRQYNFIHMWVSFWENRYVLREMPESEVRHAAVSELFNGPIGRRYWESGRAHRLSLTRGRYLRFAQIIDEEYAKAILAGPPAATPLTGNLNQVATTKYKMTPVESGLALCAAAVGGLWLGHLLSRGHRSKSF